jgi:chromosome partitioning protein
MTVLATYNIKGGVGKTAAAVNLAFLAARDGARTLLWDLDPQGAATFYFRVKAKVKGGAKGLVNKDHPAGELIKATDYTNLDLLPADFSYRHMDVHLGDKRKPTRALAKILKPLAEEYDYIILDCPPSISLVSEAVFETADYLLVPIIPTTLSIRTLEQLVEFGRKHELKRMTLLPFFSMVDRRRKLHRDITATLAAGVPDMLTSEIPYSSDVEKMGIHRAALAEFAGHSRGAVAYEALWSEIRQRIGAEDAGQH